MKTQSQVSLEPRKTPVQTRSSVTVEAILEATIQVLLSHGTEQLTTTRVAERAGVSVGTLYQYYPNKQSLLFALLERHLGNVISAVEHACKENHHQPLDTMVRAVVQAFVDAKLARRDASLALYAVAPDLEGEALIAKLTKTAIAAMSSMLKTAPGVRFSEPEFTAIMFLSAMVGTTRAVLEGGASRHLEEKVRGHLFLLGHAYLNRAAKKGLSGR